MLSSVLHSPRAVQVNIEIMRAFVRLREMLQTNKDLARKLDATAGSLMRSLVGSTGSNLLPVGRPFQSVTICHRPPAARLGAATRVSPRTSGRGG